MLNITRNSRRLYEKIQIICSLFFGVLAFAALSLDLWQLPQSVFGKIIMYIGVPLILSSLYLTSVRKVFAQRLGDFFHTAILILVISNFSLFYGGGIGSHFIFLYFLLLILSTFLLDKTIPIFVSFLTSLIIVVEFSFTTDLHNVSYIPLVGVLLKVIALFIVGWSCSNLVKRTLAETKAKEDLLEAYKDLQEASKDIEELSRMKTEFLRVVNHQLRTPVTIIKGMASMLAEGSVPPEQKQSFIQKLYLSSERLTNILDDILVAQGLVGRTEKINLAPHQLEEVLEKVISRLKPRAQAKGLKVTLKRPETGLPMILIDKEMIEKLFSRLLDNAVLYTEKGGIEISLNLEKKKRKDYVRILIKDTGIGLDKEDQKNLFKLFHRGQRAIKVQPNGSGLGLFIVKELVDAHRGEISARSGGINKGSEFIIDLPLATGV